MENMNISHTDTCDMEKHTFTLFTKDNRIIAYVFEVTREEAEKIFAEGRGDLAMNYYIKKGYFRD